MLPQRCGIDQDLILLLAAPRVAMTCETPGTARRRRRTIASAAVRFSSGECPVGFERYERYIADDGGVLRQKQRLDFGGKPNAASRNFSHTIGRTVHGKLGNVRRIAALHLGSALLLSSHMAPYQHVHSHAGQTIVHTHVFDGLSISAVTLGLTRLCAAQEKLSLNDAVTRALASRPSLKAEAERIAAAEGLRVQAGLRPNAEFQFQNENLRPGQTYLRDVDTLALINQPLDILGKRKERVAVAAAAVYRTQAEYDHARWQLAQSVKITYWTVRGFQEIRDVLKATSDQFQKTIDYHAAHFGARQK